MIVLTILIVLNLGVFSVYRIWPLSLTCTNLLFKVSFILYFFNRVVECFLSTKTSSFRLWKGLMSKQGNTLFLEEWLKSNSGGSSYFSSKDSSPSSARAIIQAWAELRGSLQSLSFSNNQQRSLETLVDSQTSLHVADPQAKLVLAILSSANLNLPYESYPQIFRLLYIWVRKSFKPNSVLIDSAVDILSQLFRTQFDSKKNPSFLSEGILLLGAFSFAPSASDNAKSICLDLLSRLLEQHYPLLGSSKGFLPNVLAGVGYALSSSTNANYVRVLDSLFGIWGRQDGLHGCVLDGLMILYLIDWVISNLTNLQLFDRVKVFAQEVLEACKPNHVQFGILMAAGGFLRALNRPMSNGVKLDIISSVRTSAVSYLESLSKDLVSKTSGLSNLQLNDNDRFLLQCLTLAVTRSGSLTASTPLFVCLALALLNEVFPLSQLYVKVLDLSNANSDRLILKELKEHLDSLLFKEAGSIARLLCNQYVSVAEDNKDIVENLIWKYCQDIYFGHRQVALVLRGERDELLQSLEKIAESAFLTVVMFALAVTKHKLNSRAPEEIQIDTSIKVLVSFSCVEYFRRMRLPEYMDTIRGVVACVQENKSACALFVKSLPPYFDLSNGPDSTFNQKAKYIWFRDEVQTARILFSLRLVPTCIERLPSLEFKNILAPITFLYMGHPNGKVARASHSLFAAFISMGQESDQEEKISLKEQLAFYFMERALSGYPEITPFEGMASGVVALARHLPAGSPATFYCMHALAGKADQLCSGLFTLERDEWKNGQGDAEPCKKVLDLLLRLTSLVDIQVLPELMKLLAQLVIKFPKDVQNIILNDLYTQVAESDDVTRKTSLVSWVQSLSYLCAQPACGNAASKETNSEHKLMTSGATENFSQTHMNARL